MAASTKTANGLTIKQEAFAKAFVELGNASDAYRRAYDADTMSTKTVWEAASRLQTKSKVAARIAELQAKIAEKHEVTVDKIVGELAKLGFSNMQDYMKIDSNGVPRLDFREMSRAKSAAIAEMTVEEFAAKDGDEAGVGVRKVKFKLHDKRSALVDLGKHLGMFKDILENTGKDGAPIEINDASAKRDLARWIAHRLVDAAPAKPITDAEEA